MNPRRLVASLLETDELDPATPPAPEPDPAEGAEPEMDQNAMKTLMMGSSRAMPIAGLRIQGYYRELANKLERNSLRDLGGARGYKVDNNTWLTIDTEGRIAVRFHYTDILTITPDDTIRLDTGGWSTNTTFARMSDWLPGGWRIYRKDGGWYWWNYKMDHETTDTGFKSVQPFTSGDYVTADGTLHPQADIETVRAPKKRVPKI